MIQAGTDTSGKWMSVDNVERFAELIVQECARVARVTPCPDFHESLKQQLGHTWDMASVEAGKRIVKHFEVEKVVQKS